MNTEYKSDKVFVIGGQDVHIKERIDAGTANAIAVSMVSMLVQENNDTGIGERDTMLEDALLPYLVLKSCSDMNMEKYENAPDGLYTLADDIATADETGNAYLAVQLLCSVPFTLYDRAAKEKLRRISEKNSAGAIIRMLSGAAMKEADGKDIGMIRSMLTSAMMKEQKNDVVPPAAPAVDGKIVDLSAYRAKKEK